MGQTWGLRSGPQGASKPQTPNLQSRPSSKSGPSVISWQERHPVGQTWGLRSGPQGALKPQTSSLQSRSSSKSGPSVISWQERHPVGQTWGLRSGPQGASKPQTPSLQRRPSSKSGKPAQSKRTDMGFCSCQLMTTFVLNHCVGVTAFKNRGALCIIDAGLAYEDLVVVGYKFIFDGKLAGELLCQKDLQC